MGMPSDLTEREDRIFDSLVNLPGDDTFKGVLCRDGVPRPDVFLEQPVRVIFVFREPNLSNDPFDMDLRAEIRDPLLRNKRNGDFLKPGPIRGWWNNKVGALAHAVASTVDNADPASSYREFEDAIGRAERQHASLWRFGYVQIKKVGGGGTSDTNTVERHARNYRQSLRHQLDLYAPHLVVGCGFGHGSPARLVREYVLPYGSSEEHRTAEDRFAWWRYAHSERPVALLEFNSPSCRGRREDQYRYLASAVREILRTTGLGT